MYVSASIKVGVNCVSEVMNNYRYSDETLLITNNENEKH